MRQPRGRFSRFCRDDSGTATVESVIWLPIFVWMLALVINVSMIVFEKNQAYRVLQNANRILSTGYIQSEAETEAYIRQKISHIAPEAVVTTRIENGVVTSELAYRVTDLLVPQALVDLANIWIRVSSQHFVEY